jgi:hypothetical protein
VEEHIAVEGEDILSVVGIGEESQDLLVGIVGTDFRANEAEAYADTMDVGVDGEDGTLAGEEEYAGGGLGANTAKALEPGVGFIERHGAKEVEVEGTALFEHTAEDGLYARGLLLVESDTSDSVVYFLNGGVEDLLPGGEAATQLIVGGPGLGVGCAVRQQCFDEGTERIEDGPIGFAVFFTQEGEDSTSFSAKGSALGFGGGLIKLELGCGAAGAKAGSGPLFALLCIEFSHWFVPAFLLGDDGRQKGGGIRLSCLA